MCYYATTDYRCGDWKWGNMKLRCPRQHRMGETCGAKLVHHESVTKSPEDCRLCQEITIKQRKLQKERDNIARWSKEGNRFSASIEKAQREERSLENMIRDMWNRRPSIMTKKNGQAHGLGTGQTVVSSSRSTSHTPSVNHNTSTHAYPSSSGHVRGGQTQGGYEYSQTGYPVNMTGDRHSSDAGDHAGRQAVGHASVAGNHGAGSRHSVPYPGAYAGRG